MDVKFWGTRGSLPAPLTSDAIEAKIRIALDGAAGLDLSNPAVIDRYVARLPLSVKGTVGGNTTCLELQAEGQRLIIDAGSGLRLLGLSLLGSQFGRGQGQANFLLTHSHWDHIHGYPFFVPAFIPGNQFHFYSPFVDLQDRLARQQHEHFFPVPTSYMQAKVDFSTITPQTWTDIGPFRVYPLQLSHPGETYGYRIEAAERTVVFASDSEYKRVDPAATETYTEFFREADLLIFDAQYTWEEMWDRPDWGHSSAMTGAEFAHRAGVKRLALTHHDPTSPDEKIWEARAQAEAYLSHRHPGIHPCQVLVAYDGLTLSL